MLETLRVGKEYKFQFTHRKNVHGIVCDVAAHLGDQPAWSAHGRAGAVVDRADARLHGVADSRPALRARWAEPARRGDGAAGK